MPQGSRQARGLDVSAMSVPLGEQKSYRRAERHCGRRCDHVGDVRDVQGGGSAAAAPDSTSARETTTDPPASTKAKQRRPRRDPSQITSAGDAPRTGHPRGPLLVPSIPSSAPSPSPDSDRDGSPIRVLQPPKHLHPLSCVHIPCCGCKCKDPLSVQHSQPQQLLMQQHQKHKRSSFWWPEPGRNLRCPCAWKC